jgi:hypothetical protein
MVTGQMSPAECEIARPMRPLDETGSSLVDPMWSVCPTRPVRQELPHRPDNQCLALPSPSSRVPLRSPADAAAPLTS